MAVDMYLEFEDEKIEGESRDDKKKGAIDILAWSWGASQTGTTHMGKGGGGGKAHVGDISATKYVDSASNALLQRVFDGNHIRKATLTVRKAGGTPLDYIIITMEDVMITSVSTGGSGGEDRLTENVTLNFAKVKFSYVPQKADGTGEASKDAGWDIAGNVTNV